MGCANPKPKPAYIIGPEGHCLTEFDLPLPGNKHWTSLQKAQVVAAVEGGLITRFEACQRYALSIEEYLTWKDVIQRFGLSGLQASRAQEIWNLTPH